MTSGAAFALMATIFVLLGVVAAAWGVYAGEWTSIGFGGVIELAALVFAVVSLRDR